MSSTKYRKKVNWDAMEADWRAGVKDVTVLAKEHGVSRAGIVKHWKKVGVERNLTAKIKAKADAKVARQVAQQVAPIDNATEKEIVEANADVNTKIQIEERVDVKRARLLTMKLFGEVEAITDNIDLIEALGESVIESSDKDEDKLRELVNKITGLPSRVKCMKDLTDALKTQIELERKVFKIDDQDVANPGNVKVTVLFD